MSPWPWQRKKGLVDEVHRVVDEREQKTEQIRRDFFNEIMRLEALVDRIEEEVDKGGGGKSDTTGTS